MTRAADTYRGARRWASRSTRHAEQYLIRKGARLAQKPFEPETKEGRWERTRTTPRRYA